MRGSRSDLSSGLTRLVVVLEADRGAQGVILPATTNHCMNTGNHREQVCPCSMPAVNESTSTCGERQSAKLRLLSLLQAPIVLTLQWMGRMCRKS